MPRIRRPRAPEDDTYDAAVARTPGPGYSEEQYEGDVRAAAAVVEALDLGFARAWSRRTMIASNVLGGVSVVAAAALWTVQLLVGGRDPADVPGAVPVFGGVLIFGLLGIVCALAGLVTSVGSVLEPRDTRPRGWWAGCVLALLGGVPIAVWFAVVVR